MQKNNKGFMITEVLIVSTIVFSILIFMYAQFRSVYNSFYQTLKYNPVESIYKANEIKSFIESDAKNNIVDLLSNSQNKYLDITECNIQTYNDVKMCKLLYEKLEIKQLLLLSEDVTSAVASNLSQLDDGMIKFIKYINNNYSGSYHRIVVAFKDGTYATLRIDVLNKIYEFDYTGDVQTFVAPIDGYYKLEVWGAQGGEANNYAGGYGGYSQGTVFLAKDSKLYIVVGESGKASSTSKADGGYNGGGLGYGGLCNGNATRYGASGGGATHIATESGLLADLSSNKNSVLIVSGGGGGAFYYSIGSYGSGSSSGGYVGVIASWKNVNHTYYIQPTGGTQTNGGSNGNSHSDAILHSSTAAFGQGSNYNGGYCTEGSGGGGGWYGGGSGGFTPGAGGSSYIGNSLLTYKAMYCYDCDESQEESTKTISTTCSSEQPTERCTKQGNGYAKISIVSE